MSNKNSTKGLEIAVVLFLLVFAFFAGVNYSNSIKHHASWLFEPKEEEIELPDLSQENSGENGAMFEENNVNQAPAVKPAANAPAEAMEPATNNQIQEVHTPAE